MLPHLFVSYISSRRLVAVLLVAALSACGGSQRPMDAGGAVPQAPATAARVVPLARLETVVFDDDYSGDYEVYSAKLKWPQRVYDAQANYAIALPHGMCAKYISYLVTSFTGSVTEVSFAGKLIGTLSDKGEDPESCAFDFGTGNVAVTNYSTGDGKGDGSVYVYPSGSGKPTKYTKIGSPVMQHLLFATYDDKSDLFVDGTAAGGAPQIDELPNGATAFHALNISAIPLRLPGALVWGGKRISVEDQQTTADNSPANCVAEPKLGCAALYVTDHRGSKLVLHGAPIHFAQNGLCLFARVGRLWRLRMLVRGRAQCNRRRLHVGQPLHSILRIQQRREYAAPRTGRQCAALALLDR